jgi:hypothetical protein
MAVARMSATKTAQHTGNRSIDSLNSALYE